MILGPMSHVSLDTIGLWEYLGVALTNSQMKARNLVIVRNKRRKSACRGFFTCDSFRVVAGTWPAETKETF